MPRTEVLFYQEEPQDVPFWIGCASFDGQTGGAMRNALPGFKDSLKWATNSAALRLTCCETGYTSFERDEAASTIESCISFTVRRS